MEKRFVYADNAATTPLSEIAFNAMKPWLTEHYGNPSSLYRMGREAKEAINEARKVVGKCLNAAMPVNEKNDYAPGEILFTGGGSQADNLAIRGFMHGPSAKGRKHIITSKIEHHAILHTCEYLEKHGYEVTYLDVDENGLVSPEEVEKAIRPDTILISIMFANNEIGTIEPIREIGEIAHKHDILFHTDAVQAYAHVPINVQEMNIDMLSASGHKFHGPKGIGFLYMSNKVKIGPLIHGGSQERSRRAGTHNVPGIVGMAKAAELAFASMDETMAKEKALRDHLIERLEKEIPYSRLNGDRVKRLPNNVNFCFRFIEGESLLILLDQNGICASSGSACTSGSLDPSHVLLAIGLPHEIAHGSLRLTLSEDNTMEEMDFVADQAKKIVERLRSMSPLYDDFVKKQNQ